MHGVRRRKMAFILDTFIATRPFAYHVTAQSNLDFLKRNHTLRPASHWNSVANRRDLKLTRRTEGNLLQIRGGSIHIRDQKPLHVGAIAFSDGWNLVDLIRHLNDHVYFWPGTERGPIRSGRNHYSTYEHERPAVLRISTQELLAMNLLPVQLGCSAMQRGQKEPARPRSIPIRGGVQSSTIKRRRVGVQGRSGLTIEPQSWINSSRSLEGN